LQTRPLATIPKRKVKTKKVSKFQGYIKKTDIAQVDKKKSINQAGDLAAVIELPTENPCATTTT